jgi:hypothetical protein
MVVDDIFDLKEANGYLALNTIVGLLNELGLNYRTTRGMLIIGPI